MKSYSWVMKKDSIKKYLIYFLILCNLSIVKIIPIFTKSVIHYGTFILTICLFLSEGRHIRKYYFHVIAYLFLFLTIEFMFTVIRYNYSFSNAFRNMYKYFYILLAPVIYSLLEKDERYLNELINFIIVTTTMSFLMRIILSIYWEKTGEYLFSDMAFEFNNGLWIRNGRLRVMMPCFMFYYVPFIFYHFYGKRKKLKDLFSMAVCLGIYFYFVAYILQTRSALIYSILMVILIFMIEKQTILKKIMFTVLIMAAVGVFINSNYFTVIYDSFYHSGGAMGTSVFERFATLFYFARKFSENPLLGMAFINNIDMRQGALIGDISDIGIIGNIFTIGLMGTVVYVIIIGRWITTFFKKTSILSHDKCLILGLIISTLLFGINIDCFYGAVVFSIPFTSALIEHLRKRT